jgi:hypothetical protein
LFVDDSPYYVPKKTNSQDVFRHNRPTRLPPVQYEPIERMEHLAESAVESNSESYRSVIDDLTIKSMSKNADMYIIKYCIANI